MRTSPSGKSSLLSKEKFGFKSNTHIEPPKEKWAISSPFLTVAFGCRFGSKWIVPTNVAPKKTIAKSLKLIRTR